MTAVAPVTAIVTAYRRVGQTLETLGRIAACLPVPSEILVHVDGGQVACANAIRQAFPSITVLVSEGSVGPGGGRNRLIAASRNELVASFDDDSYPMDLDYFARVVTICDSIPSASIVGAAVYHRGQLVSEAEKGATWVSDFGGGGCVYRRSHFLATSGYVPLPVAYNMEEVDLSLKLHAQDRGVLSTRWLRVFHDTDLNHHGDSRITAFSIANLALLAYLRYPVSSWPLGLAQLLSRCSWLFRHGRRRGILTGIVMIPGYLYRHRRYREQVSGGALRAYRIRRRLPISVQLD